MLNVNTSFSKRKGGKDGSPVFSEHSDADNLRAITSLIGNLSKQDIELIEKAYYFAKKVHEGHTRYSGDPYFLHLYATALSLAKLGLGPRTVAAGFLHDTIEDVEVSPHEIEELFGKEVLFLVEGVTKLGELKYRGQQRHVESLRRLLVATSQDIRVLLIKLMDRLHNMQTLLHVPKAKQKRIAMETLEIYAPIADRLGMGLLKRDLEDCAFPFVHPEEYERTKEILTQRVQKGEKRLQKLYQSLTKTLAKEGVRDFRTERRIKGLYSLYRKLERKGQDIEKIHDILALRIIVPTIPDCYRVLGIIHSLWKPLPGKIKDYIAFEKPNGYRSIHTTIFTGDGGTVEIQIRTEEMHREAQFGIASHLSYKEIGSLSKEQQARLNLVWFKQLIPMLLKFPREITEKKEVRKPKKPEKALSVVPQWIREIADAHQMGTDAEELLDSFRTDFFSHRVFVFTPKGDVIDLPIDSSPVDFAYAIHSDVGDHMAGAKVNGKLSSLDTSLHNGDMVEILTKESSKPTRKWLAHAKTSLARRSIRAALQRQDKEKRGPKL